MTCARTDVDDVDLHLVAHKLLLHTTLIHYWGKCGKDSGGFQMVSLSKLSKVTEEGVHFRSPYDGVGEVHLTPELSMRIQAEAIGADIIMQLDDVVSSTCPSEERVQEATDRTIRWLDRCLEEHQNCPNDSGLPRGALFPIVQGGLHEHMRKKCAKDVVMRDTEGIAIGGLSGGEEKDMFWRMVHVATTALPRDKPRYLMGVGAALDLVVCCALGVDMFDCVFPTRTARFGTALVPSGFLTLKNKKFAQDFRPIDDTCKCSTCRDHTRAFLHHVVTHETVACHLLTIHNLHYQMTLMQSLRENIERGTLEDFVQKFMSTMFPTGQYPEWAVEALSAVNIRVTPDAASSGTQNEKREAPSNGIDSSMGVGASNC